MRLCRRTSGVLFVRVESLELRVEIRCVRCADTVLIYCDVGRGDPTPPGNFVITAKLPGTVKTVPYKQPEGKI